MPSIADKDQIKRKLAALLSMTVERGASDAEALTAAEHAAHLMEEHNLSYTSVEEIDADNFVDDSRPWFRGSIQHHGPTRPKARRAVLSV